MVDKYIQKNEPSFIIILSNNLRKEAHIYYNPYPDVLKDENLEVTETKELNGILFVSLLLHPKKSYICPLCGSNYIIKNGIINKINRITNNKIGELIGSPYFALSFFVSNLF